MNTLDNLINGDLKPFQIGDEGVKINSNLRIRPKISQEKKKEEQEEALVAEVLKESPPEAKGERPEWELKTGVHRKEDMRAPRNSY